MSTIPIRRPFFYDPFYDTFDRSRFFDQHFSHGSSEDDFFVPMSHFPHYHRPFKFNSRGSSSQDTGFSQVTNDKDKFEVKLDVQQFAPEELQVKTIDNAVIVEGKHEEKQDQYGFISRHFIRRYILPEDIKPEDVNCNLGSDGVLAIFAVRPVDMRDANEVIIPIKQTGKPVSTSRKTSAEENKSEASS